MKPIHYRDVSQRLEMQQVVDPKKRTIYCKSARFAEKLLNLGRLNLSSGKSVSTSPRAQICATNDGPGCMYVRTYVWTYVCMCVYIYLYIYILVYLSIYSCLSRTIYSLCMHVCLHTHTHTPIGSCPMSFVYVLYVHTYRDFEVHCKFCLATSAFIVGGL